MFFRLTQFELYFFSVAFVVAELLTEIRSWFFFGGNPNFPNLRLIENGDTPKPAILNGERDIKL